MEYYRPDELMLGHLEINVIGYEWQFVRDQLIFFLHKIPTDTLRDIAKNCVFVMAKPPAFYIPSQVLNGRHVIWIYEDFFTHAESKQEHIILHEVTHYVCKHKSFQINDEEWEKQENEANAQVERWLSDFKKHRKRAESEVI